MSKSRATLLVLLLLFSPVFAEEADRTPAAASDDYRIGIEDVLAISVWDEPDLNMSVRVRPDGKITFPLVNDFEVENLTPSQVRDEIARRLSEFVRVPNVTVIVEEINSFKVYILGEVQSQGAFSFQRPTRLLPALANAGGFTEFSKKQITLFRDRGEAQERIMINYKRLVAGEEANPFLQPGDTLVVD
jgi:polysaccharide export outer membrane protein